MADPKVLLVVPTLGQRLPFLQQCLTSIARQDVATRIVLVAPANTQGVHEVAEQFDAGCVVDPGGLAAAINAGVKSERGAPFVNWIGDDDFLEPNSLSLSVAALESDPGAVLSFGACRYVDEDGFELWISKAGPWAPRILKWGPDLIPQPGMLIRRSAWDAVDGLDESFRYAFDLDLLLRIQPLGRFLNVGSIVSSFRWHSDSLTVGDRSASLKESELARRRALSPTARYFARLWELPVRSATRAAAAELERRARRKTS